MARRFEDSVFLTLVAAASILFLWLVMTFFDAILWAVVAAIVFAPVQQALMRWRPGHPNSMAALTLITLIAIAILPLMILGSFLLQEAATLYQGIQTGKINFADYFDQMRHALPQWARMQLNRLGVGNLDAIREKMSALLSTSFQTLAARALVIGQQAASFLLSLTVMLYLTFFMLRDGPRLSSLVVDAIPLQPSRREALAEKFIAVVRATIKGNMVVALVQGALGGIIFSALGIQGALLWGVLMAFLSLIPAVGTGIVWVPVAIYLFASDLVVEGAILVFCGVFVIGLVDNILRPLLVGRDTRMPDYMVLLSTLGGLELFGMSGFIVGPIIAAFFLATWEIFIDDRARARLSAPQQRREETAD
ncbi:MAG: AI-2E family transporter [Sphingobium sp.]|nr:AI-2E family transporter [Sphingobium sp.]MBP6112892.1 AI-2E family transporter [Sphingobium sp.]MBP8672189.1 AI-2E family transporter [Sphingobium sp.]MBP9156824.1 AI-2E family transporter [Sphingobium sp.]MCC6481643.1 AI-2E family transporter [Sphingomonadaceae bacterium]